MTPPPNMTQEQLRELKSLRKEEAQKTKAVIKLERSIARQLQAAVTASEKAQAKATARHAKEMKQLISAGFKTTRKLHNQLGTVKAGRIPENAALKAIRKRIAILEGRLSS